MMKGQVVATEYAFPLRSESGDIDLYFTEEEGKRKRLRDATIVVQTRVFSFVIKKR